MTRFDDVTPPCVVVGFPEKDFTLHVGVDDP